RTGLLIALALLAVGAAASWVENGRKQHEARSFVENLRVAEWAMLPDIFSQFGPDHRPAWNEVNRIARDPARSSEIRLRTRLAIAPYDREIAASLLDDLAAASPQQVRIISARLDPWKDQFSHRLWSKMEDPDLSPEATRSYACALAHADPGSPRWAGC